MAIEQQVAEIEADAGKAIASASDEAALEAIRVAELGTKGRVSLLMRELGGMSPEQRQVAGPALNGLKDRLTATLNARKAELEMAALNARLEAEREDLTLPPRFEPVGALHPVMQVFEELAAIFADMGFAVAEGPDIEDDFHNFTALNFPLGHPAREMHDTFFMKPAADGSRKLLRTHTSPIQGRAMLNTKPPIRVIAPGRVYRKDWDATHTPMFHQIEGIVIDEKTHMGHLKWILAEFCKAFFEVDEVKMRFRASHFPFTEPSMEVDINCSWEAGQVKIGQGNSWLEVLGSGMMHPAVIKAGGLDPDKYQGFAFGMGLDRLAMLKYGIPDLRAFFEADLRWLRHYGFRSLNMPTLPGGLS